MTAIYVDGDACPVREEIYKVASRLGVPVTVVSNGVPADPGARFAECRDGDRGNRP